MARPVKDGLDYFPKNTEFYHDPKIRALIGRFGSDGAVLYDYILCEAYGRKGYYIEIDDFFVDIIAADLKMSPEKIGLILDYLLNKSMLLDGTLFKAVKVLTSHGIQARYQEAVRGRAQKRGISVDGKLWLLEEAETEGFIQVRQVDNYSENNNSKSQNNTGFSLEESPKEKKEKEKKEKHAAPSGAEEDFQKFWSAYPKKVGKQAAAKAFKKVDVPLDVLMTALDQQKQMAQWKKDGGQYIPNPATWLNQRRWEDEITLEGGGRGDPFKQYF